MLGVMIFYTHTDEVHNMNRYYFLQANRMLGTITQKELDELFILCNDMLMQILTKNVDVFKRLKDR